MFLGDRVGMFLGLVLMRCGRDTFKVGETNDATISLTK
jgi:hypothetical protein